mmetsp:Transcript_27318/g.72377  ORF Transcript_27318/g.72377 Transcript_27318/m.72377 type:complete len:235 (+) Transcript_27318:686-1390(+)
MLSLIFCANSSGEPSPLHTGPSRRSSRPMAAAHSPRAPRAASRHTPPCIADPMLAEETSRTFSTVTPSIPQFHSRKAARAARAEDGPSGWCQRRHPACGAWRATASSGAASGEHRPGRRRCAARSKGSPSSPLARTDFGPMTMTSRGSPGASEGALHRSRSRALGHPAVRTKAAGSPWSSRSCTRPSSVILTGMAQPSRGAGRGPGLAPPSYSRSSPWVAKFRRTTQSCITCLR